MRLIVSIGMFLSSSIFLIFNINLLEAGDTISVLIFRNQNKCDGSNSALRMQEMSGATSARGFKEMSVKKQTECGTYMVD